LKRKAFVLCVALAILISGCARTENDGTDTASRATEDRYREGEIREYMGVKLDPAIGPRDNSISGVLHVQIESYTLKIHGLVNTPKEYKYGDVLLFKPYERKTTLHCVEGWDAAILWKGVLTKDLLEESGIAPDATTVIFHCADGYTTALPLDYVTGRQIILAYNANGLPLPDEMGYPFIVVAENKLGYKWARWVTEIELSNDKNYLGFWERYGYSNDADVLSPDD